MRKVNGKCVAVILAIVIMLGAMPTAVNASQVDDIVLNASEQINHKNGADYGAGSQAWCAFFVSWCARQANIASNIIPDTGSCDTMFSGSGSVVTSPQKGDLVFYIQQPGFRGAYAHVGIMVSGASSIQGNLFKDDGIAYVQQITPLEYIYENGHHANSSDIVYVRPNYSNTSAMPSNAAISISNSEIPAGENVTFNFSAANATGFVIGINNEATRIDTNDCGGNTSYTRSFSEPGTYYAYVRAYNAIGSTDSGWLPFSVLTNNDAQITGNSIPDTMTAGHSYSVAVTVKNNGTNTWTAGQYYKLGGLIDTQYFADPRQLLDSSDSIGPGQSKTFAFTMTAPSSAGTYTIAWQMSEENVISFGETLTKIVKVEAPTVNTDKTGMVPFTPTSSTVSPTKDWTIKLSGLVNENSIPDKIYVTNSDNILQTTTCTVTENNNRSLIKVIPTNGYAAGNYTLWIRDIQSTGGTVIKEQKYMDFTVVRE